MRNAVINRILLAAASSKLCAPAGFGTNLKDTAIRADYVMVAPARYCGIAERLADFRRANNDFATMVDDVDSVMAQYGTGASPDTALRNFIQYAVTRWTKPGPQFFVLAGNVNVVPSHPEPETLNNPKSASTDSVLMIDQWFVRVVNSNGTMWTDACVGRLPAWDSTSLSVMIDRTIAYEVNQRDPWLDRALSLSDFDARDRSTLLKAGYMPVYSAKRCEYIL